MRVVMLVFLLAALPATAAEIYRWLDAEGQPHYSDQWQPGAEKVTLSETVVFNTPQRAAAPPPAAAPASKESDQPSVASGYKGLDIVSPAEDEVLWNIEGQLRVSVQVNPRLQQGHGLRLYLDGTVQDLPAGSTSTQLTDVFRGVHSLKAEVVDQAGRVLLSSPTTTFAVRQTALTNPVRPIRP